MPRIPALVALTLALLTAGGCGASQPPLVQVYAAKQAYTAALNATTPLIEAGQIRPHDAHEDPRRAHHRGSGTCRSRNRRPRRRRVDVQTVDGPCELRP
jgi:hypothetical protein